MRSIKWFLDWIGRWQTAQSFAPLLKPIFGPSVVATITAIAGIIGHEPWMWIIMATSLAFMGIIVAMVFAQNYAFTITPAHKLRYAGTVINQDLHPLNRQSRRAESSSGKIVPRTIDKIQIGIQLHNTANFPISLYLESADTEMEGNKPPRGIFPKPPITVFPGNVVMVIDDPIDMKQAKCEKIEGRMLMKVRYGLRGKEVNDLTFDAKIEVLIREDGYIHGNYTHWNANPG